MNKELSLSLVQIDTMNKIKLMANEIETVINHVQDDPNTDPRWTEIAKTDLQKGIMSLTRAVKQTGIF